MLNISNYNKINTLNKKAELQILLSAWWFFVIVIIAGGVVISASIFYATDLDIKWLESDILQQRILDCIVTNGNLIDENLVENNFYRNCNLEKNKFGKGSNYFFKIWIDEELIFGGGDYSIEKNCKLRKNLFYTTKYFPICSQNQINVINKNKESKTLTILAGSNQQGKTESPI